MTWVETIPVGIIIATGICVIGYGLDGTHRLFHHGKPKRYNRSVVDYKMDARDELILNYRAAQKNEKTREKFLRNLLN
eukprot:gene6036-7520_t